MVQTYKGTKYIIKKVDDDDDGEDEEDPKSKKNPKVT